MEAAELPLSLPPGEGGIENEQATPKLSKKKQKKLKELARAKEKKKYQREQRKIRRKKRREEAEKEGVPSAPEKKRMKFTQQDSPLRIVIDCSFDDLMMPQEIKSMANQVTRCYSINRKSPIRVRYFLTSFGGATENHLRNQVSGFSKWETDCITVEKTNYLDVFKKEELVYLTSESPDVVDVLDDSKVYIIGGIVDHNRLKGLTYNRALEQGIATAALPISNYLEMASRKVLAINHVFEILLMWKHTHDWEKSFLAVIPQRKGVKAKTARQVGGVSSENPPLQPSDEATESEKKVD